MTTLLPTEQRLIDALEQRGKALTDRLSRETLERVSEDLGWGFATTRVQVSVTRRALGQLLPVVERTPPEPPSPRLPHELTPREEQLVDELERLGCAVYQRLDEGTLLMVAERMELSLSAVRNLLNKVRRTWKVEAPGLKRPSSALLPEAPVLPLGCTDPAVIARCQQKRERTRP